MSSQIFKPKKKEDQNTALADAIDKVKNKKVDTVRQVILVHNYCCGCGCEDINIKRLVPDDSPLQDGDRVDKLEKGDRLHE